MDGQLILKEVHEKIVSLSVEVSQVRDAVSNLVKKREEIEEDLRANKESILKTKKSSLIDFFVFRQLIENKRHSDNLLNACKLAFATYSSLFKRKTKELSLLKSKYLSYDKQECKKIENVIEFRGKNVRRT